MTTFDKRKDAYESKFARDEELRFKATARRNKLLGLWAAEKLGKSGDDGATPMRARSSAPTCRRRATRTCSARSARDFDAAGVEQSDHQIRRTMEELMAEAVAQIEAGQARTADWPMPRPCARGLRPARRFSPPGRPFPIRSSRNFWRAPASTP